MLAIENFPHKEVKEKFASNYFECLNDNYDENFFPLGNSFAILCKDENENANKILTKIKFNAVVKRKYVVSKYSPSSFPNPSVTKSQRSVISNNNLRSSALDSLISAIKECSCLMICQNLVKEFEKYALLW